METDKNTLEFLYHISIFPKNSYKTLEFEVTYGTFFKSTFEIFLNSIQTKFKDNIGNNKKYNDKEDVIKSKEVILDCLNKYVPKFSKYIIEDMPTFYCENFEKLTEVKNELEKILKIYNLNKNTKNEKDIL